MRCPKCGSENVQTNTFQEQKGSKTVTKYSFKAAEKHHGCLWWCIIGWWWFFIDLMIWICFFPFRFTVQLFRRKKYTAGGTSTSKTHNKIGYRTVCVCQNCGKQWTRRA